MNYHIQVLTVALWEYRRFFKLKNELLGIIVLLLVFTISYFGSRFAASGSSENMEYFLGCDCLHDHRSL